MTNEVKSFLQLLKCIDEDFLRKELKGKVHKRNYWGLKRKVLCRFSSRRDRQTDREPASTKVPNLRLSSAIPVGSGNGYLSDSWDFCKDEWKQNIEELFYLLGGDGGCGSQTTNTLIVFLGLRESGLRN